MIVNSAALTRKSATVVIAVFLAIAGLASYFELPLEAAPDINIPFVFVTTNYEGMAPEDVEKLLTIPIEKELTGVEGVEEIRSISQDGTSIIAVKFDTSINIDDAMQDVRDQVDVSLKDLPSDLEDDPFISEMNFSEFPILTLVLSGPFTLKNLKFFAEDIQDEIESLPGILEAEIVGGLEREIHVLFDMDRVAFYEIPFASLLDSISNNNVNTPGGFLDIGDTRYTVRVPEEYTNPFAINNIVVFSKDGRPVYLRDVATVVDGAKDPLTRSRINGEQSVSLLIKKRTGENIVDLVDNIRASMNKMQKKLPPDLKVDFTADSSRDIKLMAADLNNNIITGLVLVMLVVFIFIGGRSAFFISLCIPLSMLIAFLLLNVSSITLNMVVLFSLILSLGMIVDNAIVVVENIYRHMSEGLAREAAAKVGTNEVAWPVIASTATTLGAFFPMIFWPGIMGEFMSFLPITLIMTLSASLIIALTLNPVLSALMQKVEPPSAKPRLADRLFKRWQRKYVTLLKIVLKHRLLTIVAAFCLLVGVIYAYAVFGSGVVLFPETEPAKSYVEIKLPVGTGLEASDRVVKVVEEVVSQYPDIRYVVAEVGTASSSPFDNDIAGTHFSRVTLDFKDFKERSRTSSSIVNEIRKKLKGNIAGAEIRLKNEEEGPPVGEPVNMEITGPDMQQLGELTQTAMDKIRDISGVVDLKTDYIAGKPEIRVNVDKEKTSLMGLDASIVAGTIKSAVNGAVVGTYRQGKDQYDIVVKLREEDRNSLEKLRRLTVSLPGTGEPVPLGNLASVELTTGIGGIKHIDRLRVVTVSSDVVGRTPNEVIQEINGQMEKIHWPRGYSYSFTGEQEDQKEAGIFLTKAFIAAIFIIFIVLVIQFNSLATPFIILTSVTLSFIGVFFGLLVTSETFSIVMTGVGVISLAGVVVNNSIVLIDYYNQLKAKGLDPYDALIQAGETRFRPVLLTAITTILGLTPMATGINYDFFKFSLEIGSESSQWWGPMAVAVIFGLFVSTALTLVVVPVLCSLHQGVIQFFAKKKTQYT